MITFIYRIFIIVFGFGLIACSPSKFRYQNAYKFSDYNYKKTTSEVASQNEGLHFEPLAGINPNLGPVMTVRPSMAIQKTVGTAGGAPENRPLKRALSKLSKKQKKAFRRNLKIQLKEVLKERKALRKEAKSKKTAMNRKVYVGLIVAGAGIVVAILASGAVGSLAIIAGVGLIAWGLIEQGSI